LQPPQAARMIEDAAGRALEIAPDYAPALAALGWSVGLLRRRGDEGMEMLNRAVASDAQYAKARVYRAWLRSDFGDLAEAAADTEEGLTAAPIDQALLSLQAWLELCRGARERAASLSRRGLELRPDAGTLHLVLSIVESLAGRHEAAVMAGRRAVSACPGDPLALTVLAYAEARAGRMAEAQETLDSGFAHEGAAPPSSFLAAAALALGRREEAVDLVARARDEGCPWFAFVAYDPRLEPIRPKIARLRAPADG
jgi:predicted Zn-dependent protease